MEDDKDVVYIESQFTPNPNALKFVFSVEVIQEGKITYTERESCFDVPMVSALFDIPGVVQSHLFANVVTVTKEWDQSWQEIEPKILEVMQSMAPYHCSDIQVPMEEKSLPKSRENLPESIQKIEEILDNTIRPGLQSDGGDIEVVELKGNDLLVRYEGACGGCPSAFSGTLQAIEGILRDEYDPDINVIPIT